MILFQNMFLLCEQYPNPLIFHSSTEVQVNFPLDRYANKHSLFAAIRSIPYILGSTNTADGLRVLRSQVFNQANGDRPDVPNAAIIITDGISNLNSGKCQFIVPQERIHVHCNNISLSFPDYISSRPKIN